MTSTPIDSGLLDELRKLVRTEGWMSWSGLVAHACMIRRQVVIINVMDLSDAVIGDGTEFVAYETPVLEGVATKSYVAWTKLPRWKQIFKSW